MWFVKGIIFLLKDDPLTNAGYGSALNMDGMVECDAGIMDGRDGLFGAVGAVPCMQKPFLHYVIQLTQV